MAKAKKNKRPVKLIKKRVVVPIKKRKVKKATVTNKSVVKPKRKPVKIVNPSKELKKVRKELAKARTPIYSLNRKIKNAPSKYKASKLKKEKRALLASLEPSLNKLVEKRSDLKGKIKKFASNKELRKKKKLKIASIKRRMKKADEATDYKEMESLSYQEIKLMGEIDKLNEEMGATLEKQDIEDFDADEQDGGRGFILDGNSPYGIWQAVKQLHEDLRSGAFKYFVINGNKYPASKEIEIISESTDFWTQQKSSTDGTPYINRFINFTTSSVKYTGITT